MLGLLGCKACCKPPIPEPLCAEPMVTVLEALKLCVCCGGGGRFHVLLLELAVLIEFRDTKFEVCEGCEVQALGLSEGTPV